MKSLSLSLSQVPSRRRLEYLEATYSLYDEARQPAHLSLSPSFPNLRLSRASILRAKERERVRARAVLIASFPRRRGARRLDERDARAHFLSLLERTRPALPQREHTDSPRFSCGGEKPNKSFFDKTTALGGHERKRRPRPLRLTGAPTRRRRERAAARAAPAPRAAPRAAFAAFAFEAFAAAGRWAAARPGCVQPQHQLQQHQ